MSDPVVKASANGPLSVADFQDVAEVRAAEPPMPPLPEKLTPAPSPPPKEPTNHPPVKADSAGAEEGPYVESPRPRNHPLHRGVLSGAANDRPRRGYMTQPASPYVLPPQVAATDLPRDDDGLIGNRAIALSPFPNLNMQAGPLSNDQLPWYDKPVREAPFSILHTAEFQSMAVYSKSNTDTVPTDASTGWYNSLQLGVPFWREREVGVQAGAAVEPNLFPTVYGEFTVAAFHRAIWPAEPAGTPRPIDRISWGSGFDSIYDSEHRVFLGQIRTQMAFAVSRFQEAGLWFAISTNTAGAPVGSATPLSMNASNHFAFYYRHVFENEIDATVFVGGTQQPGGPFFGTYLSRRFTSQASVIFSTMLNTQGPGPWEVYLGLRFDLWPMENYTLISGNPQNRYRPFMRLADHINLQIRKRPLD